MVCDKRVLTMMRDGYSEHRLLGVDKMNIQASLEKVKLQLNNWQKQHEYQLQELQNCMKINQPFSIDPAFITSPFYLMHQIRKRKCEVCHFEGKFKFIRNQTMFNQMQEQTCLIFLICESCYFRRDYELPIAIDRRHYTPVHQFLSEIKKGLQNFRGEAQYSESIIRKYDFFEDKLSRIIHQLAKAVQKKKALVCKKVIDEVATLRQFYLDNKTWQFYDSLIRQAPCECRQNCCYCDFKGKDEEYLKINCGYFGLKQEQDETIKKIYLLNIISSTFDGIHDECIFEGIIKEVQMVIIDHMEDIEKSLNKIVQQTEDFSLINKTFLRKIKDSYSYKETVQTDNKQLVLECKNKYMEDGVLNHLTSAHFNDFSNELTSISLDYMPDDEDSLIKKLKMFQKLGSIQVGCNEIGQILLEETRKCHDQISKMQEHVATYEFRRIEGLERSRSLQNTQKSVRNNLNEQENVYLAMANQVLISQRNLEDLSTISLPKLKNLKGISFNCNIQFKQNFLSTFDWLKLEQVHLNWNFVSSFDKFNESTHFREDKSIMSSVSPSPLQFLNYCSKHPLRNIWIGNCGRSDYQDESSGVITQEIDIYNQILSEMKGLEAVMFGQFDGFQRKLQPIFYETISQKSTIKALFFNKICFGPELFTQMLASSHLIQILYLNECEGLSHSVVDQICELQYLRKLSIVQVKSIYFRKSVPSLQTFILQRCFQFNDPNITLLLQKSTLTALSLYECRFFEDGLLKEILLQQIRNRSKLSYLNLGFTQVSNQTSILINQVGQIRSLHLGGTELNLSQLLLEINRGKFKNLRKLQKFSLKDMGEIRKKFSKEDSALVSEYYNDIFSNILEYFPLLSHLDLSNNRVINERALRFGLQNLAYLTISDTQYSLKKGKERLGHSGLECPFALGRLDLAEESDRHQHSQSKQQSHPKKSSSSFQLGRRNDGLKIIF